MIARRFFVIALAVSAFPLVGACNRELQADAEVFLAAVAADDYARFETVASAELLADASEARFHDIAGTYAALGPERDRTRNSLSVENGVRKVGYTLEHERGEVQLVVVSQGEELDGFEFAGPDWNSAALERHRDALEALLSAATKGDREAARALVHTSLSDAEIDELLRGLQPLGAVKQIEVTDETIPEFRVTYGDAEFDASVKLSGASIVGYSVRPRATS